MVFVDGIEELITNLDSFALSSMGRIFNNQNFVATKLQEKLQERTSFEFQTVPSYLFESQVLKLPGRKEYPEGTDAFFAETSESIKGTAWEGQAQQYISGTPFLHDLIIEETQAIAGEIVSEVGYEKGIGAPGPTRYIFWVIYGTHKMQPRNFLKIGLDDFEKAFLEAVYLGFKTAFETFPKVKTKRTRSTRPERQLTARPRPSKPPGIFDPGFRSLDELFIDLEEGGNF